MNFEDKFDMEHKSKAKKSQAMSNHFNKLLKNFNKKYSKKNYFASPTLTKHKAGHGYNASKESHRSKLARRAKEKKSKSRQKSLEHKKKKAQQSVKRGHRRIVSNDFAYSAHAIQYVRIRPETGSNEGIKKPHKRKEVNQQKVTESQNESKKTENGKEIF